MPLPRTSPLYLLDMVAAYKQCAEWSSTHMETGDSEPVAIDGMKLEWSDEAKAKALEVCRSFMEQAIDLLDNISAESAGHDLWLTAAGHGAGFWDRGHKGIIGRRLTDIAKTFPMDLYVGDDRNRNRKLYLS